MKGILDLHLYHFSADVEEITDQALKEEKIEVGLKKLGEVWSAVEFIMDTYKETDVPMLKIAEEDWEALENDQLVVQGMLYLNMNLNLNLNLNP